MNDPQSDAIVCIKKGSEKSDECKNQPLLSSKKLGSLAPSTGPDLELPFLVRSVSGLVTSEKFETNCQPQEQAHPLFRLWTKKIHHWRQGVLLVQSLASGFRHATAPKRNLQKGIPYLGRSLPLGVSLIPS